MERILVCENENFVVRFVVLFVSVYKKQTSNRIIFSFNLFYFFFVILLWNNKIDEKNEKSKKTIKQKTAEYMARAEKLKQFLDKKEKPQAEGAGGGGGKKESDEKNDEKTKMQESLSGSLKSSVFFFALCFLFFTDIYRNSILWNK